MAPSINGMGMSGMNSLYGNRNVISGLASGMDTEAMIQNAVAGIKMKIAGLNQQQTKTMWKQEAYRNIINKSVNFSQKFTDFSSDTNLASMGFFNSATKISTHGAMADKVSAIGKSSSDIQILGVKQLATKASFSKSFAGVGGQTIQGTDIDLDATAEVSSLQGSLTLTQGGGSDAKSVTLEFDDKRFASKQEFLDAINEKLKKQGGRFASKVTAELSQDGSTIEFKDEGGNALSISGATGHLKDTLNVNPDDKSASLNVSALTGPDQFVTQEGTAAQKLGGKKLSFTVDGIKKEIVLPGADEITDMSTLQTKLQDELDRQYGVDKVKVHLDLGGDGNARTGKLSFEVASGSTLEISGGKDLGLAKDQQTNFLDRGMTLGEIMGAAAPASKQELVVNGISVGEFDKDSSIESIMTAINNNDKAGVRVSYSKTTNQIRMESTEEGTAGQIQISGGLGEQLFGSVDAKGTDAVVSMQVNGVVLDGVTRSSNTFDIDGMKVTLKGTFGEYGTNNKLDALYQEADGSEGTPDASKVQEAANQGVSFTTEADADKIIDAVKDMIKDYNDMLSDIKKAYSTMPERRSNGRQYEPLTDEERKDMSETAIKNHEEKAKTGLLFADRDVSAMYQQLFDAVNPGGNDGAYLRSIGIEMTFKDGAGTLQLDEDKMRAALEANPDEVAEAFTKSKKNGASSDGIMVGLKNTLDEYSGLIGARKGVLIERAGSPLAPSSLHGNALQEIIDNFDKDIDRWTAKLSDQVDYYTGQFTRLEKLINQMNSQSSSLMGLMGG